MTFFYLLFISIDSVQADYASCRGDPAALKSLPGRCIQLHGTAVPWDDAMTDCNSRGGQLARPQTVAEMDALYNFIKDLPSNNIYIAAKCTSGSIDSCMMHKSSTEALAEPFLEANYQGVKVVFEGGNQCYYFSKDSVPNPIKLYVFNDYICSWNRAYLCEYNYNDCAVGPCQNGVCIDGDNTYSCTCSAGWTGPICDQNIDECGSSPCMNGACNDLVNGYTCTCQAGFTGTHCEININECESSPCVFGACNDLVNGYTCTCQPGYTGIHCEIEIDECESEPCQYNGTCTDEVNSYTCACIPGITGPDCEIDIDECASEPCQNGGTCLDQINSYVCECPPDWTDIHCDLLTKVFILAGEYLDVLGVEDLKDPGAIAATMPSKWRPVTQVCKALGNFSIEQGRKNGMQQNEWWNVREERLGNRITGVNARNGSRFLGVELDAMNGTRTVTTSSGFLNLTQDAIFRFHFLERTADLFLKVCVNDGRRCIWKSNPGIHVEDRHWQIANMYIPAGGAVDRIQFVGRNVGLEVGAIAVDDIQLLRYVPGVPFEKATQLHCFVDFDS